MATIVLNLHKTLEAALTVKEGPITRHPEYRFAQMLPNDTNPYIQQTSHATGVVLEDPTVEVHSLCGKLLQDITDYFLVKRVWIDDAGQPQIDWQILDCPHDFGPQLIYLHITQAIGEEFWSNVFELTEYESEKTTRYDYKQFKTDAMQSIRLKTYFRQDDGIDEMSTYTEANTGNLRTKTYTETDIEHHVTEFFSNQNMMILRKILNHRILYIDLIRANLAKVFEMPKLKQRENFGEADIFLSFSRNDIYDPNYVPPVETFPTTVTGLLKVYRRAGGDVEAPGQHRVRVRFMTPAGFETVMQPSCFITFNGVVTELGEFFGFNAGEISGVTIGNDAVGTVPNTVQVSAVNMRVANSDGEQIDVQYALPEVNFTAMEIYDGIEKQIIMNIVTV